MKGVKMPNKGKDRKLANLLAQHADILNTQSIQEAEDFRETNSNNKEFYTLSGVATALRRAIDKRRKGEL